MKCIQGQLLDISQSIQQHLMAFISRVSFVLESEGEVLINTLTLY